jgi:hypothetical protein
VPLSGSFIIGMPMVGLFGSGMFFSRSGMTLPGFGVSRFGPI